MIAGGEGIAVERSCDPKGVDGKCADNVFGLSAIPL